MVAIASQTTVEGHISRGFEAVREAFAENFIHRHELGGACCAYGHGEKVVGLWGGIRNKETGQPWEQDTMVVVHSATKGLAATPAAGSTTKSGCPRTGPSSRSRAKRRSRYANSLRIRQDSSRSKNLLTATWWPTSIVLR